MQRRTLPTILALFLVLGLPLTTAADRAAEPTVRHQATLQNIAVPGQFDLIMRVLDFPAGAGAAPHTHAGPVLNIVLEGAITLRRQGTEPAFATGETWVDPPDLVHDARNTGTAKGSLLTTFIVPKGAQVSAPAAGGQQPPLPAPTTRSEVKFEGIAMTDPFQERMAVLDFAPGASQPARSHPGPAVVTVGAGTFTLRHQGNARVINAGESWIEQPDLVYEVANTGSGAGALLVTELVPKGAAATTPGATPAAGGGGMARRAPPPEVLVLLGGILLAGALMLRRRLRRA